MASGQLSGEPSRAQRRRILRAVRNGEALEDPNDAVLAVDFADRLARSPAVPRWYRWAHGGLIAATVVVALAAGNPAEAIRSLAIVVALLGTFGALSVTVIPRLGTRARAAAEQNRALVDARRRRSIWGS